MRSYSVHSEWVSSTDVVFVKEGLSWPAFLLGPVWLAAKRLWVGLAVYGVATATAIAAWHLLRLPDDALLVAMFGLNLIAGLNGNDLLRRRLTRSGRAEIASVVAPDVGHAALRYFSAVRGRRS